MMVMMEMIVIMNGDHDGDDNGAPNWVSEVPGAGLGSSWTSVDSRTLLSTIRASLLTSQDSQRREWLYESQTLIQCRTPPWALSSREAAVFLSPPQEARLGLAWLPWMRAWRWREKGHWKMGWWWSVKTKRCDQASRSPRPGGGGCREAT